MDAARKGKHVDVQSSLMQGSSGQQETKQKETNKTTTRDHQLLEVPEKKPAVIPANRCDSDVMVRIDDAKTYNSSEEARAHAYNEWLVRKQHARQVKAKQSETVEKKVCIWYRAT